MNPYLPRLNKVLPGFPKRRAGLPKLKPVVGGGLGGLPRRKPEVTEIPSNWPEWNGDDDGAAVLNLSSSDFAIARKLNKNQYIILSIAIAAGGNLNIRIVTIDDVDPQTDHTQTIAGFGSFDKFFDAVLMEDNKLLIFGGDGGSATAGCAHLTWDGATASLSSTLAITADSDNGLSCDFVEAGKAIIAYGNSSEASRVQLIDTSGVTPVLLGSSSLIGSTYSGNAIKVIDKNTALWASMDFGAPNDYASVKITISGSSLTPGTIGLINAVATVDVSPGYLSLALVGNNIAAMVGMETSGNIAIIRVYRIDFSGTPSSNSNSVFHSVNALPATFTFIGSLGLEKDNLVWVVGKTRMGGGTRARVYDLTDTVAQTGGVVIIDSTPGNQTQGDRQTVMDSVLVNPARILMTYIDGNNDDETKMKVINGSP